MLVTDGVVRAQAQHRRHVALLEVPDAVSAQDFGHLPREGDRIVQVVEHCDRGDDAGVLRGIGCGTRPPKRSRARAGCRPCRYSLNLSPVGSMPMRVRPRVP